MAESGKNEEKEKPIIILHSVPRGRNCSSPSPFTLKVETFLRINKLQYTCDFKNYSGPKGNHPWITDTDGSVVADSQFIIEHLTTKNNVQMLSLSPQDAAVALGMKSILEDNLYFVLMAESGSKGDFKLLTDLFPHMVPRTPSVCLQHMAVAKIRSGMNKKAHSQGIGRHSRNAKFLQTHERKHLSGQVLNPGEEIIFKCPVLVGDDEIPCEKTFKLKCNLDRHIRSHQRIKTHMCGDCGKSFVDSTRLKEHRWIHSGYRPFQCRFCDKSFRHQNHLKNHEANVHGEDKKFCCQICSKKFVYAYQLRTHLANHRNDEGNNTLYRQFEDQHAGPEEGEDNFVQTLYQCSLCHQVLATFQLLQEHCLHHADHDNQNDPDHAGNIQSNRQSEDEILIEISDPNSGMGLEATAISEDGQQFVVVYDVPTNE